ncbi:unnamed protein product, partial [Ectocarpus fasciculatus]
AECTLGRNPRRRRGQIGHTTARFAWTTDRQRPGSSCPPAATCFAGGA